MPCDRSLARPALYFSLLFISALLLGEFIRVDDITGGQFERTNSTTRWWGWIWAGGLAALGAPLLGSKRLWMRGLTMSALASITLVYAIDTVDFLWDTSKSRMGKMRGDYVYTVEPAVHAMFQYLAVAPQGIVLENQYADAYHDGGVYAAFANKPVLLGWRGHEIVWRGRLFDVYNRYDQFRSFHNRTTIDPLEWLKASQVSYIV